MSCTNLFGRRPEGSKKEREREEEKERKRESERETAKTKNKKQSWTDEGRVSCQQEKMQIF